MKYIYWAIITILSFVIQGQVSVFGISPDMTALLAYYAGIRHGETKGMFIGVLIGLLQDISSPSIIGPNLLAKGMIGFFSSLFISGGIFRWTPLFGVIALCLLTVLDNAVVFWSTSVFDSAQTTLSSFAYIAVMQALLNACAGIFIRPKHEE